jgi:hypothetical protein
MFTGIARTSAPEEVAMPTTHVQPEFQSQQPPRSPHIARPRREVTSDVPDTPEARAHAREAEEIDAALRTFGIEAERVAPTRDFQGHVRLNFEQVRTLLGL